MRRSILALAGVLVPLSLAADHAARAEAKAKAGGPAGVASGASSVSTPSAPTALPPKVLTLEKLAPPPSPEALWVGATTDATIAQLAGRARREGERGDATAIASLMALPQIADDALAGAARSALENVGHALVAVNASAKGANEARVLGYEALTIARSIAPDVGTATARAEEAKLGLVSAWRIVGPFRDTSGTGLERAEGPEIAAPNAPSTKGGKSAPAAAKPAARASSVELFRQLDGRWDDGDYEVAWRAVPPELVSARGVPLDALIYPRKESCTYLASTVSLDAATSLSLRVASAGAVRVLFDGVTVARDEEEHTLALADRIAVRVEASKGSHLLALKVCSGPGADAGRVRARVVGADGAPLPVGTVKFSDDLAKLPSNLEPPKFTVETTTLARLLAAAEKADAETALAAAMARRLGGADDLRSPRAQGLLDAAVAKSPRPDVLAMAAILAPSRGNQTAWMNAARGKTAGADAPAGWQPVAAFALRSITSMRLHAGYADWAATTVASTELRTADDLDAKLIRAELAEALGDTEAAFAQYKAIWDALGDRTPTSVLRALGKSTFGRPSIAARALDQAMKVWPRESPVDWAMAARVTSADAVKQAVKQGFRLISSAEQLEQLTEVLHGAGLEKERVFLLKLATDWTPNRHAIWTWLAQALAASSEDKERQLAAVALSRAAQLDRGSPFLRAEMGLLADATKPDDEALLPTPAEFLARRKGVPAGGESALPVYDRQLDWQRVVTVDDAGRVAQLVHYSREIVKAPKDASDLDEPHVPAEGDQVEIVRARVHRRDGSIAVPQEIAEGQEIRIRWTDLKPGDVVEVATRGYTALPIGDRGAPPFFFLDYAGGPSTHPVLWNDVWIRAPKRHPLYTAVTHTELGPADVHEKSVDKQGRNVEHYLWKHPIEVPPEPFQPKGTEIFPTIIGSQFQSWDEFAAWYKSGVDAFASVDPRVRRRAEEITKNKKTRDEKVVAIFNWIADQVKYVNYVSAEAWLPNRPQNVLDRMQGDCDDKAMLLITMLKAIGVTEAQEVLVQTRYTGMPSLITAKGAVAPLFDHGIAFLPAGGGLPDRYLDATSPESRIGPLPSMDARAAAIRITPSGTIPVVSLPAASPKEHGVHGQWSFALRDDGSADVKVDEAHSGDSAFFLRTALKKQANPASWLEKNHDVGALKQVEVQPNVSFVADLPGGNATLAFSAKSDALARREGTDLVVPLRWGFASVRALAPLAKRVTAVELPPNLAPSENAYVVTITPPSGYRAATLTPSGEADGGKYGKATLKIEAGPKGTVVVRRSLVFDQSLIPVAEYDRWRAWVAEVDALFAREVRFVKGAP